MDSLECIANIMQQSNLYDFPFPEHVCKQNQFVTKMPLKGTEFGGCSRRGKEVKGRQGAHIRSTMLFPSCASIHSPNSHSMCSDVALAEEAKGSTRLIVIFLVLLWFSILSRGIRGVEIKIMHAYIHTHTYTKMLYLKEGPENPSFL